MVFVVLMSPIARIKIVRTTTFCQFAQSRYVFFWFCIPSWIIYSYKENATIHYVLYVFTEDGIYTVTP